MLTHLKLILLLAAFGLGSVGLTTRQRNKEPACYEMSLDFTDTLEQSEQQKWRMIRL
jgi:hypothetical protein